MVVIILGNFRVPNTSSIFKKCTRLSGAELSGREIGVERVYEKETLRLRKVRRNTNVVYHKRFLPVVLSRVEYPVRILHCNCSEDSSVSGYGREKLRLTRIPMTSLIRDTECLFSVFFVVSKVNQEDCPIENFRSVVYHSCVSCTPLQKAPIHEDSQVRFDFQLECHCSRRFVLPFFGSYTETGVDGQTNVDVLSGTRS